MLMKRLLDYLGYFSLALNLLFIGTWIIVFYKHDDNDARIKEFDTFLPGDISSNYDSIVFIVLTVLSIIVFAQYNCRVNKILLITQAGLLALLLFGLL